MRHGHPKIAVIGGGTGSFTLLRDLKHYTPNLSAIVNMCDDGGSTGVLRDELGVLPPGDVRQCLAALSDQEELRDLFSYRFSGGRFDSQSLGNIILSGLELQYGSFEEAVAVASRILRITGQVIPVTLGKHQLVLHDGDKTIVGESTIDKYAISQPPARLALEPAAILNPTARQAILQADIVVIAPGNVFSSLLPSMIVEGLPEALQETTATVLAVSNLVTKPGQTDGWHVVDFIRHYEQYLGDGQIDVVLYNTAPPSADLLKTYGKEGEFPVDSNHDRFAEISAQAIGKPLIASATAEQDPHDTLMKRTLIRHDGSLVSRAILDYWRQSA